MILILLLCFVVLLALILWGIERARCVSAPVTRFTRLRRGDVISIARDPSRAACIVKRIIAIPGDILVLSNDLVFVNGSCLYEPYLAPRSAPYPYWHVKLKADEYWVMGDNRDISVDSREFGPVRKSEISRKLLC